MYPANPFTENEQADGQGIIKIEDEPEVVFTRNSAIEVNPLLEDAAAECFWDLSRAMKFKAALYLEGMCVCTVIVFSYFFKITEIWRMLHIVDDTMRSVGSGEIDVPPLSMMLRHELPGTCFSLVVSALFLLCGYHGMTKRSTWRLGCWSCCTGWGVCNAVLGALFCIAAIMILPKWTDYALKCDARPICMPDGNVTDGTLSCLDGSGPNEFGMMLPEECHGLDKIFLKCPHHHHPQPFEPSEQVVHQAPHAHVVARFFVHFHQPMDDRVEHEHHPRPFHFFHLASDPYSMHHHGHGVLNMQWKNMTHAHGDKSEIQFCKSMKLTDMLQKNMFCCKKFHLRCDMLRKHYMRHTSKQLRENIPKAVRKIFWCGSAKDESVKKHRWCCKKLQLRCPEVFVLPEPMHEELSPLEPVPLLEPLPTVAMPTVEPMPTLEPMHTPAMPALAMPVEATSSMPWMEPMARPDEMPVSIVAAQRRKLLPVELWQSGCKVNKKGVNDFHTYVVAQPRLEIEVYLQLFTFLMIYLILAAVHTFACYTGIKLFQETKNEARILTLANEGDEYAMYPVDPQSRAVPLLNEQNQCQV